MVVWTFVHRELTRRGYARQRSEEEFYAAGTPRESLAWNLLRRFWSEPPRGR
jgi:hypothetical protein